MSIFCAFAGLGADSSRCIAGVASTKTKVLATMKELNVQLDNLCQVLQQTCIEARKTPCPVHYITLVGNGRIQKEICFFLRVNVCQA